MRKESENRKVSVYFFSLLLLLLFLFLTCRKFSPLLLQVLRQWEQAPLLGSITESTVSRKEAAECKIQEAPGMELAREVVEKGEQQNASGNHSRSHWRDVCARAQPDLSIAVWALTAQGCIRECEWSVLDPLDTCTAPMPRGCHSLGPGWATCITSSSRWSNTSLILMDISNKAEQLEQTPLRNIFTQNLF